MLHLDVFRTVQYRPPSSLFKKLLPRTLKILIREEVVLPKKTYRIELSLIGDAAMTALNIRHHRKNRPTDVISLSYFERKGNDEFAGEIFIALPYAKRQAAAIGQSLQEELRFLFVHGLLHIFGYDHQKPKEEAEMLRLTYEILKRK